MKKKIKIKKDSCIGCGTCAIIAPEIFEVNEEGVAQIKGDGLEGEIEVENEEQLKQAVDSCPVDAIEVE